MNTIEKVRSHDSNIKVLRSKIALLEKENQILDRRLQAQKLNVKHLEQRLDRLTQKLGYTGG